MADASCCVAEAHDPERALPSWRPSTSLSTSESYGRFEILGRVGRGGMAEILLARERSMAGSARYVVIKRILPEIAEHAEMLEMFLDEARVVMGLAHANVCQIYEVGSHEGSWYIAMEWVHGVTLHELVRRAAQRGEIDSALMARIVAQCAEALHHAHVACDAQGRPLELVHRDVSPHNIMVAFDGRVKLLDFGIAKTAESRHVTESGVVKGKVCYMAPEQWLSGPIDGRSDVFALGACLYETLTGQVLFRRDSQTEIMKAILQESPPRLREAAPHVPQALADIVSRALARRPRERFQTGQEMAEAIEQFLCAAGEPVTAARLGSYVRGLFRREVEQGPLLERTTPVADLVREPSFSLGPPPALPLSAKPVAQPPPPATPLAAPTPFEAECAPETASPDPLTSPRGPTRSSMRARGPRPSAESGFDAGAGVPTVQGRRLLRPSTPPSQRPIASLTPLDGHPCEGGAEEALDSEPICAFDEERVTKRFDDATRPFFRSSPVDLEEPSAPARPPARTLPMRATALRRIAWLALAPAAAMLLGIYAVVRWSGSADEAPALSAMPPAIGGISTPPGSSDALDAEPTRAPNSLRTDVLGPRGPENRVMVLLSIDSQPWSTVSIEGRVLGTTPIVHAEVPREPLTLKLVDAEGRVHMRELDAPKATEREVFFELR